MTIEAEAPLAQNEDFKKMASGQHGYITMKLGRYIGNFVEDQNLGHTLDSSTMYNFQDGQPKRQPDVSFISLQKLPEPPGDEDVSVAPDLAVEVVSKNDTLYEIEQKVTQYQQVGVGLIWIVRPFHRVVEIYELAKGSTPTIVGPDGELDGKDVLPGFKLPVRRVFAQIK